MEVCHPPWVPRQGCTCSGSTCMADKSEYSSTCHGRESMSNFHPGARSVREHIDAVEDQRQTHNREACADVFDIGAAHHALGCLRTSTSQMTSTGDTSEKRVNNWLMLMSASRILGPVLYQPTTFSRAAQGRIVI
eukprot:1160235-Pelagomonas_calceolata.AAC.4